MDPRPVHTAFFSPTYTTRRIVGMIASETGLPPGNEHDLSEEIPDSIIDRDALLVAGIPVYAGRVPQMAVNRLKRLHGNGTPAIAVAVYGNRAYDDALLELTDLLQDAGFKVISAGAFIARHSIFPNVGSDRPDARDADTIRMFARKSTELINPVRLGTVDIAVKGNRPYRNPGNIPLKPKGNHKCNDCGACVRLCPAKAIPADNPRKTLKEECISCGRCIVVCPRHSRHFGGIIYKAAGKRFEKANSIRRFPETFYAGN